MENSWASLEEVSWSKVDGQLMCEETLGNKNKFIWREICP